MPPPGPTPSGLGEMARAKQFLIILIKPSHYARRWLCHPVVPLPAFLSNSLASVYSLIDDSRRRKVLGAPGTSTSNSTWAPMRPIPSSASTATTAPWSAWSACSRTNSPAPSISAEVPRCRHSGHHGGFHAAVGAPPCCWKSSRRKSSASRSTPARPKGAWMEIVQAAWPHMKAALQSDEGFAGPVERHAADPAREGGTRWAPTRVLTQAEAARSNARSAPSSTCRAASPGPSHP